MVATDFDVPAILGFDPFDPTFLRDPYAHYRRLRSRGSVQRTPAGLWVSPSHRVCATILRDPRFSTSARVAADPAAGDNAQEGPRAFLFLDPPDHTRLRRLVSKAFSARMVERLRPRVMRLVDTLLTDALAAGTADLLTALAYPLPITVISELLGVPETDRGLFRTWSQDLARSLDPDFLLPEEQRRRRDQARLEFSEYFRELTAHRRTKPRDDLLSALVAVEDRGDTLSEAELLATCVLLLVAGHETTANLIGNGTLALLRDPARFAWFRENLDAAPAVVEELLRYDPPVQLTARIATESVDIDVPGEPRPVRIAEGELILLLIGAANRDPAVFARPDTLDFGRDSARQLAFGLGIHFCLGAPLARLEGQVALAGLTARAPALALMAPDPPYKDNLVLRGLAEMPVRLR